MARTRPSCCALLVKMRPTLTVEIANLQLGTNAFTYDT